jgi:hypothetical protein
VPLEGKESPFARQGMCLYNRRQGKGTAFARQGNCLCEARQVHLQGKSVPLQGGQG